MLKALVRTGIFAGVAYGAYYVARQFWADEIDEFIGKATDTAKDIVSDFRTKDEAVNKNLQSSASRKAV
jgi:hypothetical protein